MPRTIQVDGVGPVNFPDGTSDDDVLKALGDLVPKGQRLRTELSLVRQEPAALSSPNAPAPTPVSTFQGASETTLMPAGEEYRQFQLPRVGGVTRPPPVTTFQGPSEVTLLPNEDARRAGDILQNAAASTAETLINPNTPPILLGAMAAPEIAIPLFTAQMGKSGSIKLAEGIVDLEQGREKEGVAKIGDAAPELLLAGAPGLHPKALIGEPKAGSLAERAGEQVGRFIGRRQPPAPAETAPKAAPITAAEPARAPTGEHPLLAAARIVEEAAGRVQASGAVPAEAVASAIARVRDALNAARQQPAAGVAGTMEAGRAAPSTAADEAFAAAQAALDRADSAIAGAGGQNPTQSAAEVSQALIAAVGAARQFHIAQTQPQTEQPKPAPAPAALPVEPPKPAAAPAPAPELAPSAEPIRMSFEQFQNAPREGRLLDELRKVPKREKTPEQVAAAERDAKATEAVEKAKLGWIFGRSGAEGKMVEAAIRRLPKAKKKLVDEYEAALTAKIKADMRGQEGRQRELYDALVAKGVIEPPAPPPAPGAEPTEQARTSTTADAFERARRGDDAAFDDLDAQFREIYPEPEDIAHRGRPDPNQVYTAKQFADRFNTAFAARDFQTILDTIKATSDVSIWKPFLKDLFATQAKDPIAAKKAEWFRHVFNGTVPPDAIPRAPRPAAAQPPPSQPQPQPGAQPGAQPGGGPGAGPSTPPPQPPAPPPPRIEVEPITGGKAKSPFQIIEDFSAAIKKSIRVLRLKRNTLGTYTPGSTRTAERFAGDLDTAAHELAGHWTDDRYGIGKPWIAPRVRSPYDAELAKFWIHGSVTPTSTLRYRRAEGIAEFIRAYVVNPVKAKAEAPNFAAYFERTLPADALKAINDFGTDVRTWAGEDPLIRAGLNIRMEPPGITERLWKGIRGRGFGFEINPIDKLRLWFDDPYHYAVKAFHEMRAVRGGTLLPKDNFELQARLLATHDARMSDQFEHGLTPLRPTQSRSPTGELVVDRIVDPVTQQPMSMKWMLDPLDKASKAKMNQDMRDASAFMVAQRTLEKGAQTGRESQISGIGAGIMTDKKAALELLNRVAQDPPREARLKEAARRYRLWADSNIDMLVDSGRLSPEQAREIRKNNQQYVDMHRLSQEFEMGFRGQHGRNIGTARNVIKRFKGSTLELDNVYSNLLEQTDAIQKEAFRNVTMNTFTDQLRNVRALHGPDLKDFDQFGTRVTSEDKNTIRVFKDGKGEYWKFDPDIYESLKGLGELGTHPFIDLASKPSQFVRYMITHGPQFILRNTVRDTFERSVVSRSGSRPWDIMQGYTPAELSRYEVFGGGQFGNYIVDRHVWNRELKKAVTEMSKDPKNIFLSPLKLKTAWERLSENSEKLGRIAEFRRAFEHGQKQLGYDDYNAALYAAGEARGLLDFAKAGTVMRSINRLVPFSNARIRGLARATSSMAENPGRFAMRWGMFVLAPTLANLLWNRKDKETWDEYQQLPAYQKDFFWNFKVGPYWLRIPKPHELGVMAGGVTRAIDRALGDKRAMEGWWGSAANAATPLNTPVESTGPLRSFLELYFNKDSFQGREIVPAWEKDLKLELRKGVTHASGAGQAIAKAINATGLGVDPRQVDYVLQNFGGLGQIATDLTRRSPGESALRATGYIAGSPGAAARDVQWVFQWARENGKMNAPYIRDLTALRKLSLDAKTVEERNALNKRLREASTYLRSALEPTK